MTLTFGTRDTDEREQHAALHGQAFNVRPRPYDPDAPAAGDDRVHVARLDGRTVGTATVMPFGQWFGGRRLPTGGISAVAVAPEARGLGIARRLLADAIVAMRERGEVLSGLFPTTARLYRSVGYEHAARLARTGISVEALGRIPAPDLGWAVRRVPVADVAGMATTYEQVAADHDGWLSRGDLWWQRTQHRLRDEDNRFSYVVEHDDAVEGVMVVEHAEPHGSRPGFHLYDLAVDGPFCTTPEAFAAALRFLAGHGTTVGEVVTALPVELLALAVPDQHLRVVDHLVHMLRLVDAPGAVAARGYLVDDVAPVELAVRDPIAPWNDGDWRLSVEGGEGRLVAGGSGRVEVDAPALAALWSGWSSPWQLALAGRLRGATDTDLVSLARAFAARSTPSLLDFY